MALLERDAELEEATRLIAAAQGGAGAVLVLEGPAGMGKTALLDAVCERGAQRGLDVLRARGGELEHDLAFGVVRQLLTPPVAAAHEELLHGAAALAGPVLGFGGTPPSAGGDPMGAALHGLHWLCVELALRRPVLLAVDDAHWADAASLRFLAYLARRLDGVQLLMAVAARPNEPGTETALLDAFVHGVDARTSRLAALSPAGSAELVRAQLRDASDALCGACHETAGGNPFLLSELASSLAEAGVDGASAGPEAVAGISSGTIARAVLARISRLPRPAVELARATALFPEGAQFRHVAALADLDEKTAAGAADQLVDAHVLAPGRPLKFLHPLMRTAVHRDLPHATRARGHARAADVLQGEGASPEAISTHLLAAEPAGRADVVEVLLTAAGDALAVGAAEAAVRHAQRALEEPAPPLLRARVLHQLGLAELLAGRPEMIEHLRSAVEEAAEAPARAAAALDLGRTLGLVGRPLEAVETIDLAIRALGDDDPEVALRFEAEALWVAWQAPETMERFRQRVDALPEPAGETLGEQLILCYKAHLALTRLEAHTRPAALARRALAHPRVLEAGLDAAPSASFAIATLALTDGLEEARAANARLTSRLQETGAIVGVPMGHSAAAELALLAGDLGEAETEARLALAALEGQDGRHPGWLWARNGLVSALSEQGRLDEAEAECPQGDILLDDSFAVGLVSARGRLRAARGDVEGAAADLERTGEWMRAADLRDPVAEFYWRGDLALVRLRQDRSEEARALVDELLADARRSGSPLAVGHAMRFAGLTRTDGERLEFLQRAVEALAMSSARLLHAKALVELGSTLRRANRRADARGPLREGLHLARRCRAAGLADLAEEELRATGARPRRLELSGVESLTPSERRIAAIAAAGRSNREIAEELWLTVKTVEMHLSHAYRKLGIRSRSELAQALTCAQAAASR